MPKNKKIKWVNMWTIRPYPPSLMNIVTGATIFGFKKVFQESTLTRGGNYWKNGLSNYFYIEKELSETIDRVSKKALKSPEFFYNFLKIALVKSRSLRISSDKYLIVDLQKRDIKNMLSFLDKSYKTFFNFYSYATLAALFGYKDDNLVYKKAEELLKKKTGEDAEKFSDYFIKLTNPPKKLKPAEQELKILALAKKVKKRNLKTKKEVKKYFGKDIEKIKKEFSWLSFDFTDKISWDDDHYIKLVLEKTKCDINKEIDLIKNYSKNTSRELREVYKKINLNKKEKIIFEIIRNTGYYKWAREYEFQKAFYNIKFILDEIGRRYNLTSLEMKYLLADELSLLIKDPKKYKKLAKDRIKNSLIISDNKKSSVSLLGEEAEKYFEKMDFSDHGLSKQETELKGMPARGGRAKGIVRIIDAKSDLAKMKKGDILISQATTPDLLSAMKKAAAIATNEGGITCHAAIVSRELGIPCVVGLKIVTEVFKDGDLVEVDANKGIIKKIK